MSVILAIPLIGIIIVLDMMRKPIYDIYVELFYIRQALEKDD